MNEKLCFSNYINGKWHKESNNEYILVLDKFSGALIAKVPEANDDLVEEAIESSVKGFEKIKSWSAGKRSKYLYKLHGALKDRAEEAANLIVQEAGKPLSYARAEVTRCLSTIEAAAIEAKRIVGEIIPIDYDAGEGRTAFTKKFPVGPVLCITPFNFPMNLVLHKVAPALACGCSVIVKPAPQAPLSALFLANLLAEVGYPAGVANFINCSIELAEKMVRDERLKMISFTGSEKVGWYIKGICGVKKVALELGGNAAVVVDDQTDIDMIAKKVAIGAFLYAGQICISTQRIFVHESLVEKFQKALVIEINALKVGDPKDESTIVGPLIDKAHVDRISSWVKEAEDSGAEILTGGCVDNKNQMIFNPTLIRNAKSPLKIIDEEVFGPIAIIESFSSFDEALAMVNDSKFGLQAGIFTNNLEHMKKAHESLEVAGIIINDIPGFRIDTMPYGGVKMSGLGREGLKYAIDEMTEPRLIIY
jgi:acyl-CoA reductase-like NAD-dependent aldehyde dehydrogenase